MYNSNSPSKQSQKKEYAFPPCSNNKESRMVCLSDECNDYAFFCSNCQEPSCETSHYHQQKLSSISYKQFTKRIFKQRKPIEVLANAISSYRQVLHKLRLDVNQFIEKQMQQLDHIYRQTQELPENDSSLIQNLKNQLYQGLTGKQMDILWNNCNDDPSAITLQQQTAEFINIKEEQVKGISSDFEVINEMNRQNRQEEQSKKEKIYKKGNYGQSDEKN